MKQGTIDKLKRLIDFRERQRDIAAADMEKAQHLQELADEECQKAEHELASEIQQFRDTIGTAVTPAELDLAVSSAKWAQIALKNKEQDLKKLQNETEQKRSNLLESHKKVKQMETLHESRKSDLNKQRAVAEQAELDDLAVVKEVSR